MKFREGDVVSCSSKIKVEEVSIRTGTICWIIGNNVFVLDIEGYIHNCAPHEIYEVQK